MSGTREQARRIVALSVELITLAHRVKCSDIGKQSPSVSQVTLVIVNDRIKWLHYSNVATLMFTCLTMHVRQRCVGVVLKPWSHVMLECDLDDIMLLLVVVRATRTT